MLCTSVLVRVLRNQEDFSNLVTHPGYIRAVTPKGQSASQLKGGISGRVFILGGGIENILSFGGSKRNKLLWVVSLGSFFTTKIGCHRSEK